VEVVLTFATTVLPATDVTRKLSQPDAVATIAKQLEALLYTSKGSTSFEVFRGIVSGSGSRSELRIATRS
jgi:predicted RNase H-like nuclease (RuvC/YqgF family)